MEKKSFDLLCFEILVLFIYLYFEYQKQKFLKILKLKFLHDKHRLRERRQRPTDSPAVDQVKLPAAGVREDQRRGTNELRCQEFCEKQLLSNALHQLYCEAEWKVEKPFKNLRPEGIHACEPDKDQWGVNRNTIQKPMALDHLTPLSLFISEVSSGKQGLFQITASVRK